MQKGFATLEAIFFVLIISILTAVAIPQAKNLVERATLDYEQKRLYSELKALQTFSRSASVSDLGMSGAIPTATSTEVAIVFDGGNRYEIQRSNKPIREAHVLSNGVTFSKDKLIGFTINFHDGKANTNSATIIFKPRKPKSKMFVPTIVFDSVGRIRGGREQLP